MAATASRPRRHDPERRDRIVDAALDVIAIHGVAGTTHRRIAEVADVPLGSMTYHFTGMSELLEVAFTRFAGTMAERFERRLDPASTAREASQAVVEIITHDVFGDPRDLVLTHELYTLAARDPRYRSVTNLWMRRSRAALEQHFDPSTAMILDALIEGFTIHEALDTAARDPDVVIEAVRRVTGTSPHTQ